jgi:tetratricopeptide (TPR) repeat protein
MGKSILFGAILLAASVAVSPLSASGGYGGGMPSGGMGGMNGGVQLDDYSMALKLIRHEKYADAIPYLERTLAKRPHNADVLNYLGFTHRMVGDYQISLAYYQKALQEDPDHKGAHEYLGELYLNMHDLISAQGQLAELTRICPSDCDERDTLTKSIASYQAANPPVATPAPAAQPAAQPSGTK